MIEIVSLVFGACAGYFIATSWPRNPLPFVDRVEVAHPLKRPEVYLHFYGASGKLVATTWRMTPDEARVMARELVEHADSQDTRFN